MIYEQGSVKVDRHFARFGSKSYAIDKINSVDVREETKTGCAWGFFAAVSALMLLIAIGATGSGDSASASTGWVLFAASAGVTFMLYKNRPKPVYHLMLATSSGEIQATNTGDREAVMELRAAIESAMSTRA